MSPNTYMTLLLLFFLGLAVYGFCISRESVAKDTPARKTPHAPPNPPANEVAVLKGLLAEAYMENARLRVQLASLTEHACD